MGDKWIIQVFLSGSIPDIPIDDVAAKMVLQLEGYYPAYTICTCQQNATCDQNKKYRLFIYS